MATAIVWPAPIINFFFYSFSATGLSLRLSIFLGRVVCYPSFFPLHYSIYRPLLSFSPLFLQHRWSDSLIALIFIHRVLASLVHIVHYSGELLILVWHSETDGPDTSLILFTGFPWSITGRLHGTYVSSHGVLPFPRWIRESIGVNRLRRYRTPLGFSNTYIHTFTCMLLVGIRRNCLDGTDPNKLDRRLHMECIGQMGIRFADDFSRRRNRDTWRFLGPIAV